MKKTIYSTLITAKMSLALILIFSSCEEENDMNKDYGINVQFSEDTIQIINENIQLDGTNFLKNSTIDDDTFCLIKIGQYHPDKHINNLWVFDIRIPKYLFHSEGIYELGNYKEGNWIEFERYFYENEGTRFIRLTSYELDSNLGYFELYNETDSTFNIKFNNINLYNPYLELSALTSCDLVVRKSGDF
jgi:hypothetical protein